MPYRKFRLNSYRNDQTPTTASDAQFRLLVESVKDYAIFMLDTTGHIITWNAGAQHLKGYTAEEIIGQHFSRFYREEEVQWGKTEHVLNVAIAEGRYEEEGWRVRKDGSLFWANVVITSLNDSSGSHIGFAKVTRDLTWRKKEEDALRKSEVIFQTLLETASIAIILTDERGRIVLVNTKAEETFGYSRDEFIGQPIEILLPNQFRREHIEHRSSYLTDPRVRAMGHGMDLSARRKDGTKFPVEVGLSHVRTADGVIVMSFITDITERKRAEATLQESALEHARLYAEAQQALRVRDQFISIASHELKTPLTAIKGYTHLLQRYANQGGQVDERFHKGLRVVQDGVTRLNRLTDQLLDLSRIQGDGFALERSEVELCGLLRGLAEAMEPSLHQHTLQLLCPDETVVIQGDELRLEQLFQNLLSNAIKFSPDGGLITVEVRRRDASARVAISDEGIGIPEEAIALIYERFYRASNSDGDRISGMGLGLYIVRHIIEAHGGTIEVASEQGRGSTFTVTLPLEVGIEDG